MKEKERFENMAIYIIMAGIALSGIVGIVNPVSAQESFTVNVPSTAEYGVTFSAPVSGNYRITITGGAWSPVPATSYENMNWLAWLHIYKNRTAQFEPDPNRPGLWRPVVPDFVVGDQTYYPTYEMAEAAGKGLFVDIPLNKGDYLVFLPPDHMNWYYDNRGGIYLSINVTEPPTIEINEARMVAPSILGVNATIEFSKNDPKKGPRYAELKATINGQPVKEQIDVTNFVNPGEKTRIDLTYDLTNPKKLSIDLANAHDDAGNSVKIPRFTKNEKFTLEAVAWSSASGRSETAKKDTEILLPVIIIHGVTRNWFEDAAYFIPYIPLQTFLIDNGYDADPTRYKTLYGPPLYIAGNIDPKYNWGPPDIHYYSKEETGESIASKMDMWIYQAKEATYADKVNIVGHSLGGLIGRYSATEHAGSFIHKVIMIGTPNHGSTEFYINTYKANEKGGEDVLKTSSGQPNIRNWLSPAYSYPSLYTKEKTGDKAVSPEPIPNLFHKLGYDKSAPIGVSYYSIFSLEIRTNDTIYVKPIKNGGWYKYVDIRTKKWGDGTVLGESAISTYANNIAVNAKAEHAWLPGDPAVQSEVLASLKD